MRQKESFDFDAHPDPTSLGKVTFSPREDRTFRELVNALPEAIYTVDAEGYLTYCNPAAEKLAGRSPEPGTDRWSVIRKLFHPNGTPMPASESPMAVSMREGRPMRGSEIIAEHSDGRRIWLEAHPSPMRDDAGNITGGIIMLVDITGRKNTEEKLRKKGEKYRTLFESIDEGFCIIRMIYDEDEQPVDYYFEEVNSAFEEQTGLQNVEGKTMREIIPEHEDHWFETYGNVDRTGEPIRFEEAAGALGRVLELYAFPFGPEGGHKLAVLFNDITDREIGREEREKLLREVENERERLRDIFQRAPSFMCILRGSDHVFERVNDLYYELVGDRDLIGKPLREAIPEVKEQGLVKLLDRVYQTNEPFMATDKRVVLNRGKGRMPMERYLDFVYQPLRNSEGEVTGIFVQGVDLTERRKAKEELQEMNETLEKRVEKRTKSLLSYQNQLRSLASRLSKTEEQERRRLATELHDNLGQMLAVNKMKMELVDKEELPNETAADLEDIKQGMSDALLYARELMSDLKPPPSLDKEDVKATIEWLAQKMEKHDLEVNLKDDGQPKQASEHIRTTLLQSVRELLFNVIKHTDENTVRISMSRHDNRVQIVVEDDGPGFDPDGQPAYSPEEGGFGLFNVSERIDLLGGSTDIHSKPEGGTRVTLLAPLKAGEQAESQSEPVEDEKEIPSIKSGRKIKVLLADDHQMMRKGLKKIVDAEDDLVVIGEASNGEEAIGLARETMPDIIVMDVNMPVMDGIDATKRISSIMPRVSIIGLSLHNHQEVIDSMRHAGASAYLSKNEAFETLTATIRSEASPAED